MRVAVVLRYQEDMLPDEIAHVAEPAGSNSEEQPAARPAIAKEKGRSNDEGVCAMNEFTGSEF